MEVITMIMHTKKYEQEHNNRKKVISLSSFICSVYLFIYYIYLFIYLFIYVVKYLNNVIHDIL